MFESIRTITKRKGQYSVTVPVKIARDMGIEDKEEVYIQYDQKTKTMSMNRMGKVE